MKFYNIIFIFLLVFVSSCYRKAPLTKEIILKAVIDDKGSVDLNQAVPVLTKRLTEFRRGTGLTFQVKVLDGKTISVKTSSASETALEELKPFLTRRGRLAFHEVHQDNADIVRDISQNKNRKIPPGYELMTKPLPDLTVERFIVRQRVAMAGKVAKAYVAPNTFGGYEIIINFTPKGTRQFAVVTKKCVGNQLAIIVDNKLYSAPKVLEAINQGNCRITGDFTQDEAKTLILVLNTGTLPCKFLCSEVKDINSQDK